jgi:uncharacterized protein (UPF0332 family)
MNPEKAQLVKLKLANAKKTLGDIEILIENKLWNIAVNRLYYACFYGVTALLHNYELDTKTHSGTKRTFSLHFIKPGIIDKGFGRLYTNLMAMQQKADYEDTVEYEQEDVLKVLQPAHELIAAIEVVLAKD